MEEIFWGRNAEEEAAELCFPPLYHGLLVGITETAFRDGIHQILLVWKVTVAGGDAREMKHCYLAEWEYFNFSC